MSDIDFVIKKCVEAIYDEHDTDHNGSIDLDEAKKYVLKICRKMDSNPEEDKDNDEKYFSNHDF